MTAQHGFWLFMAVATLVGGAWALIKIVAWQFERRLDERFQMQEKAREEGRAMFGERFGVIETNLRELEKDHLKLKAELPLDYVRRDDQIRRDTIIDAKLDAMNARLQQVLDRRQMQGAADGR